MGSWFEFLKEIGPALGAIVSAFTVIGFVARFVGRRWRTAIERRGTELTGEICRLTDVNEHLSRRLEEAERQIASVELERVELERALFKARATKLTIEQDLVEARAAKQITEEEMGEVAAQLGKLLDAVVAGNEDIWRRKPVSMPEQFTQRMAKSIPIIMIGNLKGGVGKTTLAANLAAYFDRRGERILLIDLDFQGSLTATTQGARAVTGETPNANRLLSGGRYDTLLMQGSKCDSRVVDCFGPFSNFETRLMLQWIAGNVADDVRYRLADILLSSSIQTKFDRVIIDTAPRISTGFINALCAATHLIIPTILDRLSTEAAGSFLTAIDEFRPVLLPGLREFRIAISKKTNRGAFTQGELDEVAYLRRRVVDRGQLPQLVLDEAPVATNGAFKDSAGKSIAYFDNNTARALIDPLGDKIAALAPSRRTGVAA